MTAFQIALFEALGIGTCFNSRIRQRLDKLEAARWAADNPARVAAIRRVIARLCEARRRTTVFG